MQVTNTGSETLASVKALLEGAIDYAGLFPAGLSMSEAVINYATYRNSNYNWMLGRFVLPVGRLEEFQQIAGDFVFDRDAANAWRLSVIGGDNLYDTLRQVEDFNAANSPGIICDTLEIMAGEATLSKTLRSCCRRM